MLRIVCLSGGSGGVLRLRLSGWQVGAVLLLCALFSRQRLCTRFRGKKRRRQLCAPSNSCRQLSLQVRTIRRAARPIKLLTSTTCHCALGRPERRRRPWRGLPMGSFCASSKFKPNDRLVLVVLRFARNARDSAAAASWPAARAESTSARRARARQEQWPRARKQTSGANSLRRRRRRFP